MAVFGITRQYLWFLLPITGFAIGGFLDYKEVTRLTRFRDRSALYGKDTPPKEPSWPVTIL